MKKLILGLILAIVLMFLNPIFLILGLMFLLLVGFAYLGARHPETNTA